jgi:gliding motility-associated-like protein
VAFNNTQSCGGTAGPTGIAEVQFGFQALDVDCNAMNQGWDFPWGLSTPDDSNHPGWIYSPTTSVESSNWTNLDVWADYDVDPPYYAGDTITFPLGDFYQASSNSLYSNLLNAFDFWLDQDLSIQAVIWQISYGPTMYADNGGWAEVGSLGGGITPPCCGIYDDDNFLDNWVIVGPCGDPIPEAVCDTVYVDLPPDTVVIYEYDTIPVAINWYFYDTTYIYSTDTLYLTEYLTDTIYVPYYVYDTAWVDQYIYDTTYVYILDTVLSTEYVYDTVSTYEYDLVGVECDTGLPCLEPIPECPIYLPNAFTPDNDGLNDVWGAETNESCWLTWVLRVYSRYGDVVWESEDPNDIWLGGDEYYVPSDVYNYQLQCSMAGSSYVISGYVTIVR